MSVIEAFDDFELVNITYTPIEKTVNTGGYGEIQSIEGDPVETTAMMVTEQLKSLELNEKGSFTLDEINLYFVGEVGLKAGYKISIDGFDNDYIVIDSRYRMHGNFEKTTIKSIDGNSLTYTS